MIDKRYYLIHGQVLKGEHETIEGAIEQANKIIAKYGNRHSHILIGDRHNLADNDLVAVYIQLVKFTREGKS